MDHACYREFGMLRAGRAHPGEYHPGAAAQTEVMCFLVDVAGMAAVIGQPSIEGCADARPLSWVV